MDQIIGWWGQRNEADPRPIAYQQQLLDISGIRQMLAMQFPNGSRRAVPVHEKDQGRPRVNRPRDRDTGMKR